MQMFLAWRHGLYLVFIFLFPFFAFTEVPCTCPVLACDACSFERGVTFYSDKCGPNNSKVRSCARPTCIPVEQPTNQCPNPPQARRELSSPVVMSSPVKVEAEDGSVSQDLVGKVKVIRGSVSLVGSNGQNRVISSEGSLHERETIEVTQNSAAMVKMEGGNKLHIHPGTKIIVQEFKDPSREDSRRVLLHLIKGKVRNQVERRYNGKTSYYKVLTKTAVAGVRGTDFVVQQDESSQPETRVETLKGHVLLSAQGASLPATPIYAGEGAVLTTTETVNVAGDKVLVGKISPVYKIAAERLRQIDIDSRVDVDQSTRVAEAEICKAPAARFDQCVWQCRGNSKRALVCQTSTPNVFCVRSRCNANGEWSDETPLAPGRGGDCPAHGYRVGDCDY